MPAPWTIVKTGNVSVKRCDIARFPAQSITILLLGATGSGKSSFIEALAGPRKKLGISGGTFESVTKDIQAYEVVNMKANWSNIDIWPVYIIDTPGFSDAKMAEVKIVKKLDKWEKKSGRITDTRVPGSAWGLLNIINSFGMNPGGLVVVTSMWDKVHKPETLNRAEARFFYLRDVIWKDKIDQGARIVKFKNTHSSAIEILAGQEYGSSLFMDSFNRRGNSDIARLVYTDLLHRIANVRQERQCWFEQRLQLVADPDPNHELEGAVVASLKDADEQMAQNIAELAKFRQSPVPDAGDGVNDDPRAIIYQCLHEMTLDCERFVQAIEFNFEA
ncbi:hypothetical protein CVT24_012822 [Panaeolus cyanescens]|uniref:G domain-containing protein n=1 Tax=Panaeolus cyanescens TaxID=181874 RepID=A0A409YJQ7_9AGAR|nr:hypothetical protein CVT24_012822 [Panaeolus cyanescens]